jgi:hypothetical protein
MSLETLRRSGFATCVTSFAMQAFALRVSSASRDAPCARKADQEAPSDESDHHCDAIARS